MELVFLYGTIHLEKEDNLFRQPIETGIFSRGPTKKLCSIYFSFKNCRNLRVNGKQRKLDPQVASDTPDWFSENFCQYYTSNSSCPIKRQRLYHVSMRFIVESLLLSSYLMQQVIRVESPNNLTLAFCDPRPRSRNPRVVTRN